jgi:DNA-directed RNA polymerase subunit M/transcription elongation factor TFIIS
VRLPWQAKEYERSCTECGYTWRVPRSAARQRVRSISGISVTAPKSVSVDRAELARQISSISASNEPAELYRQCPKCGAADFTQRAFRAT